MPGECGQSQRGKCQKPEQHGAGHSDLIGNGLGKKPWEEADDPCGHTPLRDIDVQVGSANVGQHAHQIWYQQAESHDQNR